MDECADADVLHLIQKRLYSKTLAVLVYVKRKC